MALIRRLFALVLTLAVIVSGTDAAVARAEMEGATSAVICGLQAGAGPVMLDTSGRPLTHHAGCPHCLTAGAMAAAVLAPVLDWTPAQGTPTALHRRTDAAPARIRARVLPLARGPPSRT